VCFVSGCVVNLFLANHHAFLLIVLTYLYMMSMVERKTIRTVYEIRV